MDQGVRLLITTGMDQGVRLSTRRCKAYYKGLLTTITIHNVTEQWTECRLAQRKTTTSRTELRICKCSIDSRSTMRHWFCHGRLVICFVVVSNCTAKSARYVRSNLASRTKTSAHCLLSEIIYGRPRTALCNNVRFLSGFTSAVVDITEPFEQPVSL